MIGTGAKMRAIFDKIRKTAPTAGRVLITGENGTGKELIARALHENSKRADKPFMKLNCAAIPQELIESELFGHEKGAFTSATQMRRGKFELAGRRHRPVSGRGRRREPQRAGQGLAASCKRESSRGWGDTRRWKVRRSRDSPPPTKNLTTEIESGRFREDLYYRLNVVPIDIPPLREHKEDIPPLVDHFMTVTCADNDRKKKTVSDTGVTMLMHIRLARQRPRAAQFDRTAGDLDRRRAGHHRRGRAGHSPDRQAGQGGRYARGAALKKTWSPPPRKREIVLAALDANAHHIANTARELQLERSHLYKKMKALGINPRAGTGGEDPEGS